MGVRDANFKFLLDRLTLSCCEKEWKFTLIYGRATRFFFNVHCFFFKKKKEREREIYNADIFGGIIFSEKIEFLKYQLLGKNAPNFLDSVAMLYLVFI